MEKSLKLKTNNAVNLMGINFNSFSSSSGWAGYFYTPDLTGLHEIKQASQLVETFFNINDFFMISALSYNKNKNIFDLNPDDPDDHRDILKNRLFGESYKKAIDYGFLQESNEMFFLESEQGILAQMLRLDFDSSVFLEFCEVLMAYYFSPVIGQECFLINPKLGIALYPHDDHGYGCISLNNTDEEKRLLVDFLKFCAQNDSFEVFIEQ
ncbi:hypothetical protein [Moraxella cuniculi]|uniref:DUF3885 domain-containing protein n=1 Tax=Moraxella cuniculi TaxID=34061 RepID=A0A3S4T0H0_9GAMM|nr:hypothetical protein [Moraxella cuniculi]VEG13958.1 Uncharacterised protein [Moraxella cuniculi]